MITARKLDRISFEQALIDFEVANTRVIDLTQRLTALNAQLSKTRTENERLKLALAHKKALVGPGGISAKEAFKRIAILKSSRVFALACVFSRGLRKVSS